MYSDRRVRSDDGLRRQADKTEAEEESGVGFRDEDQQFGWCVPEIHTRWQ